ncbi:MarR family winged helix-turn-helix transcriptional regulator [Tsukamurella soli]|uniref:MarR family winged helix-turn-helix transcriptional regulator n=1 Tax=Tsukamurella soli TaxID=644556 RepID=A0ABP8K9L5_9ACTN
MGNAPSPRPSLLYAIKQVELAVRSRMDAVLAPSGITPLQYTALTVLHRRDGLSVAQLARNSFVTAQTMGEMITVLEHRGLVSRRVDPTSRRRTLTSVTQAGLDLLTEYDTKVAELEESMVATLTPRQRHAFATYLNSCRVSLGDSPAH